MAPLAPFEPRPLLAAAVSGGSDSMALAVLAAGWVRPLGGALLALVVDHELRTDSRQEADTTMTRLASLGIEARLLPVVGLARGAGLAERARAARFAVLAEACAAAGILHLLLGHHAGDQAETLLMRALSASGPAGMSGMLPLVEAPGLRLLRPLLAFSRARLQATLTAARIAWVEDPSNADMSALRPRLRMLRGDRDATGPATDALVAAAQSARRQRAIQQGATAAALARHVCLRPEGFALLSGEPLDASALSAVLQMVAGAPFPPPTRAAADLASALRPATLHGVRLMRAGRMGKGWLAVREAAAMEPPVPAVPGAIWDGRFRMQGGSASPAGATIGALGEDATRVRQLTPLPYAVLQTLPAIRRGSSLLAVPHLSYPDASGSVHFPMLFSPPRPAAAAPLSIGDA